jgi:hypothetical protein
VPWELLNTARDDHQREATIMPAAAESGYCYLLTEGWGRRPRITPLALEETGNVHDALERISRLPGFSAARIEVVRPAPADGGPDQVLPVDWATISRDSGSVLNYPLMSGDRIVVTNSQPLTIDPGSFQEFTAAGQDSRSSARPFAGL